MKKRFSLRVLLFLTLSADFGVLLKKVISPVANLITDSLHIPGGIGTPFSISVVAAASVIAGIFGSAMFMSLIQAVTAFFIGSVGAVGALAVISYMVPGLLIDIIILLSGKIGLSDSVKIYLSSILGSVAAALTANILVFGLRGVPLLLYISVSATTGALCAFLMELVYGKIKKAVKL
ncbi:MAG: hypothetical protein MJ171_01525 [Clostridia bacterium]|nr:hypothetical protein [Clostridia bacterium]